jgi:hypothetical protein
MWEGSTVNDRDLNPYMTATKDGCKNALTISGIVRKKLKGKMQTFKFDKRVKQTFVIFNASNMCPASRYIFNSGEIVYRHGVFHWNISLQKRTNFNGITPLVLIATL